MNKITLATWITISRLALIPLILFFYIGALEFNSYFFFENGKLIALIIFIVAAATDWLDGFVARRFNQVSDIGKHLDPIVDKMLVYTGFILIIADHQLMATLDNILPRWLAILSFFIVIVRDVIVGTLRQISTKTIPADGFGKAKTIFQFLAIALFMFYAYNHNMQEPFMRYDTIHDVYRFTTWFIIASAMVLTVVSGVNYVLQFMIKENKEEIQDGSSKGKTVGGE